MDKKWYQQFWPWFLMFLPACAVVAGISTVIIAHNNRVEIVVSDMIKDGKILTEDLSLFEAAQDAGARFSAKFNDDEAWLLPTGDLSPQQLQLSLYHPTQSKRDVNYVLELTEQGYALPKELTVEGEWEVRIEPMDHSWRLQRRLDFPIFEDVEFGLEL